MQPANQSAPVVAIEPAQEDVLRAIGEGLRSHNIAHGGAPVRPDEFVVTLRDTAGTLIGGMTCDLYLGGMLIEWAWIAEAHRGAGHGRALLAAAEAHGIERGASFAHLDTFTFQARGFYESCGYEVFGTLPYPGGVERYYMRKTLTSQEHTGAAIDARLADALSAFGLVAADAAAMSGGLESAVWRVGTAKGTFAARRHMLATGGDDALNSIASELAWLDALGAHGSPLAPRPVRRGDGELAPVTETDASGHVVACWTVLGWVEGAPLDRLPTPAEAHATGALVAAMHHRARNWTPPAGFVRPAYDASLFRTVAAELFANVGDGLVGSDKAAVEQALDHACAVLDRLWAERQDIGVIHADLHDGNLMWAEGAEKPAVIDFSRCGLAPLALDVAMAQHYLTPELAADLLAGYLAAGVPATFDASVLPALRYLAAVENLAILSRFAEEAENVAAELPWLAGLAQELVG